MKITLRPIEPGDMEFLYWVYASTREAELAVTVWDDAQKETFLQMQFNAQHTYYREYYPNASFQVILCDGQPAGRLYVDRWPDQIRVMDIALLAQFRNAGVGTRLLNDLLAEGALSGKPVTIHVEMYNPAMRLYERLGFSKIGERGVYYLMEWRPPALEAEDAKG
ncbi:MAG: hypothetical protein QOH93_82 [Chloroflexia bacterium]|jgi:ribosomal protein S18 acetylase RimI-like enzyme|nr:hypothetical protein [Chloroflexia bacterium]